MHPYTLAHILVLVALLYHLLIYPFTLTVYLQVILASMQVQNGIP